MTIASRSILIAVVVCLSLVAHAAAQEDRRGADKTLSPFFFVENADPAVDRLPLKDTSVDVAVSGVIADVTVRQVYENRGQRPLHARYVFPASTRAAVYGMTMTVGDTRIVARIKEREKAKHEFESAKRDGKSASLLEESRPNVFTMSVANVLPGDTIAVELKYTELLVPTDGVYEFVYPTVVGPRYSEKPDNHVSPTDRFVKVAYTHQGEAPREERFSGNRDFILRYRLAGRTIGSGLLLYQGTDENFFLLTAQPPQSVTPDELPAREYIFVVDVSGSMYGFPLNTARS
jgi:Ca-activated chloride channel homolog